MSGYFFEKVSNESDKWKPVRRNRKYAVRSETGEHFYEFSTINMDSRMSKEMARHCNVARRQAFEELLPALLLARERIISIDNGDCFDAVLALEEAINKAK